ncbi:AAA family ATPase [Agrococcus sp. DT81.2]|uniref:AAA family ATPase n=1 Tax=Agrococcus sp. DT81.2 TaxID=3393414 RepID=UPI003CE464AC
MIAEVSAGTASDLYIDAALVMSSGYERPSPSRGAERADGLRLLYAGAVNGLVGDPETGKTLIATAIAAEGIARGESVLWIDVDHNGPAATLARLGRFGVQESVLLDTNRFRLAIPDEQSAVLGLVADAERWHPDLVIVDSMGEILPMFGASTNSADEFTNVNMRTLARLAKSGAAVLALDHMAKGAESRQMGAAGTFAKKRAVDGAYLRVSSKGFKPGEGGLASLSILKDRHGSLRAQSPSGQEPEFTTFILEEAEGEVSWRFIVPDAANGAPDMGALLGDLRSMDPQPRNYREVEAKLRIADKLARDLWRTHRAMLEEAEHLPAAAPAPAAPAAPERT